MLCVTERFGKTELQAWHPTNVPSQFQTGYINITWFVFQPPSLPRRPKVMLKYLQLRYLVCLQLFSKRWGMQKWASHTGFSFKAQFSPISLSHSYNELQSYATQTNYSPFRHEKIWSLCAYQCLHGFSSTQCFARHYDSYKQKTCISTSMTTVVLICFIKELYDWKYTNTHPRII